MAIAGMDPALATICDERRTDAWGIIADLFVKEQPVRNIATKAIDAGRNIIHPFMVR